MPAINLLQIDWPFTWSVTISGFAIVFMVLVILILVFTVFGKIMQRVNKKSVEKKANTDVVSQHRAVATTQADAQINPEVAAVITAAVAEVSGGKNFIINDIKKTGGDE